MLSVIMLSVANKPIMLLLSVVMLSFIMLNYVVMLNVVVPSKI
jgi:hypothetical protein